MKLSATSRFNLKSARFFVCLVNHMLNYGYNRRKSETEKRERFSENRNVVTMKIKKSERENGPKIGNVVTMADFWSRFSVSDFRSL